MSLQNIKTGDIVRHKLTNEQWIVTGIRNDRLVPGGWPPTIADLKDCELIESRTVTEERRLEYHKHFESVYGMKPDR